MCIYYGKEIKLTYVKLGLWVFLLIGIFKLIFDQLLFIAEKLLELHYLAKYLLSIPVSKFSHYCLPKI